MKNKHRTPSGGQKKIVLGGPKEEGARRVLRKVKIGSLKVVVALTTQRKSAGSDVNNTKAEARTKKGKGKEGAYPQSGFSASEAPSEERYSQSLGLDDRYSNFTDDSCSTLPTAGHTAWMAAVPFEPCQPSGTRCSGSWLHTVDWIENGNQKVPETCVVLHYDGAVAMSPLCLLPTLRLKLFGKAVLFIIRQHLHVLPELM